MITTYSTQFRKTILLGCIYKRGTVLLDNDCSIRVYQSFVVRIFPIMLALCLMFSVTYYAQTYAGIIGWSLFMIVFIHSQSSTSSLTNTYN